MVQVDSSSLSECYSLGKVPRCECTSNDNVLAGDDELGKPEDSKEVDPAHTQLKWRLGVRHKPGLVVQLRFASGLQGYETGCPQQTSNNQ